MQCKKCNVENETNQKFCKSCGAPMGIVCDRCGSINRLEDRHCGACGQPLAASLKQDVARPAPAEKTQLVGTRQYTTSEIEELLLLRKAMKANEQSNKIMNQDEIDNLFK